MNDLQITSDIKKNYCRRYLIFVPMNVELLAPMALCLALPPLTFKVPAVNLVPMLSQSS